MRKLNVVLLSVIVIVLLHSCWGADCSCRIEKGCMTITALHKIPVGEYMETYTIAKKTFCYENAYDREDSIRLFQQTFSQYEGVWFNEYHESRESSDWIPEEEIEECEKRKYTCFCNE